MPLKSVRPPPSMAPRPEPAGGTPLPAPGRRSIPPPPPSTTLLGEARVVELEEELDHERRIASALREVGLALGTTVDLDELLTLVLDKVRGILDADRATLYLLDETGQELHSRIAQGSEVKQIRLKVGEGIAGHVARTGKRLLVKDAHKDARFDASWDRATGYRTRGVLCVPMRNHLGRVLGVMQVLNKQDGDFTVEDAVLLAALATQAAVCIDNVRLFSSLTQKNMELLRTKEQLEHRVRDLKLLFDLESAMGRAVTLEELFASVLREAMRVVGAKGGAFLLEHPVSRRIVLHVMDDKHKRVRRVPLDEAKGFAGAAMRDGEVVLENDVTGDPRLEDGTKEAIGFEPVSVLAVPLEGEDESALGSLALYNKKGGFLDEDRALLILIAANASTAIRLSLSREVEEQEERLSSIGRLLSGVLHDLKTPLSVISGYAQILQQTESKEHREQYAQLIHRQLENIVAMQRDVLEFARGERTLFVRKVYLAQFFQEVQKEIETELARRRVELVIDLQFRGTARFDEQKMLRVIHNLARNAAEAMAGKKDGRFTIQVSRDDDGSVVMKFSDTGPGIPKEIEHRIFQSFVTSGKKGGTGLGLAIVKGIAEEHGGTVTLRSSARGATFTLRLPQDSPRLNSADVDAASGDRPSGKDG